jgi:hypothetical protein
MEPRAMSYFDDYVADGLCCEQCGGLLDGIEPGFVRVCAGCQRASKPKPAKAKRKGRR